MEHSIRRFLVLDDDDDNRVLARHALRRVFPGCEVIEATTLHDALTAARGTPLDGVVTDHHLGTAEGADFISTLRDEKIACPVIMVTASNDPEIARRAYEAGAARVFSDSFDFARYFLTHRNKR